MYFIFEATASVNSRAWWWDGTFLRMRQGRLRWDHSFSKGVCAGFESPCLPGLRALHRGQFITAVAWEHFIPANAEGGLVESQAHLLDQTQTLCCFCFFFFFWLHQILVAALGILTAACRILVAAVGSSSPNRDQSRAPRIGSMERNYWTTRQVLTPFFKPGIDMEPGIEKLWDLYSCETI